ISEVCDGAEENRTHIKSFDWCASSWQIGDIIEAKFCLFQGATSSFHLAKIVNMNEEQTNFTIQGLQTKDIHTVIHSAVRLPMPSDQHVQVNDLCECFRKENGSWYEGRVN